VTALNLGCQCSDSHFDFLHKWFDRKAKVFEDGHCYQRPLTANRRLMFSKINLIVKENILTVKYEGSGTNGERSWDFTGTEVFQLDKNQLKIIDSKNETSKDKKYND
jgi:hypothetical protein